MVTAQQKRVIVLAQLLIRGKPVKTETIHRRLAPCSSATLTRTLNILRRTYGAVIAYHRSNQTYEMTDRGTLTDAALRALEYPLKLSSQAPAHGVDLRKDQRVRVSLSLPRSLVRKLNQAASSQQKNRSQWVEHLIRDALDLSNGKTSPPPSTTTSSLSEKPIIE